MGTHIMLTSSARMAIHIYVKTRARHFPRSFFIEMFNKEEVLKVSAIFETVFSCVSLQKFCNERLNAFYVRKLVFCVLAGYIMASVSIINIHVHCVHCTSHIGKHIYKINVPMIQVSTYLSIPCVSCEENVYQYNIKMLLSYKLGCGFRITTGHICHFFNQKMDSFFVK